MALIVQFESVIRGITQITDIFIARIAVHPSAIICCQSCIYQFFIFYGSCHGLSSFLQWNRVVFQQGHFCGVILYCSRALCGAARSQSCAIQDFSIHAMLCVFFRTTCCFDKTVNFAPEKKRLSGTEFQPNGWNAFFLRTACCSLEQACCSLEQTCCSLLYHGEKMLACMQILFALAFFARPSIDTTVRSTERQRR